jgi:transcriptional regulator with XRE-family HTH domain
MIDFISGTEVRETPEELVVQALSKWLVAIGYRKDQIQTRPQFGILNPKTQRTLHVEIAVFRDHQRTLENLLIIAEAKKDHAFRGLDQLHRYLRLTSAQLGIWFNGTDLTYLVNVPNVGKTIGELGTLTGSGFGAYVRRRREELRATDPKKFSGRAVSARLGCEPSYLNRIELGRERPPSDDVMSKLAVELGEDENVLFAQAGRISPAMNKLLLLRPAVYAELLEFVADKPDEVLRNLIDDIGRRVKDGKW